ncbi:hypothetical protein ALC60_04115 [Trachymyrmex zeteki]|uniref:Uncharacterized protein n=1 Tax=Mycetomoellerius zeteki TaxID=64791 RepID=A0A151X968_9HYME|nr:hypothetical protein ALC60_04115 [Trachymyrmex zeteki]
MSTRLAFSHAQKARHISVPTFSLFNVARPRLGGMASANVGESKVTREKKRRGKVGKDEPADPALNSARLMGDALLASSATQSLVSRVKEREALSSNESLKIQKMRECSRLIEALPSNVRKNKGICRLRECAEWPLRERNANISIIDSRGNSEKKLLRPQRFKSRRLARYEKHQLSDHTIAVLLFALQLIGLYHNLCLTG